MAWLTRPLRLANGRRWLMKALYASDQMQQLTTRDKRLVANKKPEPGRKKPLRDE